MAKPLITHAHPEMRWMIRADLPQVLKLDELNNAWDCWSEQDYLQALRRRKTIGMVCEFAEKIVGVVVYDLEEGKIFLQRFEVDPGYLTTKAPQIMLNELKNKMKKRKAKELEIVIPDSNEYMSVHQFWAKMGFKSRVKRNFFSSQTQDGYSFTWEQDKDVPQDDVFKTDYDV